MNVVTWTDQITNVKTVKISIDPADRLPDSQAYAFLSALQAAWDEYKPEES